MESPLNRERTPAPPNVVPASFLPDPVKYESPVSQELRTRQSQLAQGYTLKRVSYLENQRHLAPYKRDPAWQRASEVDMGDAIKVAKTARTVMLNNISAWAGKLTEEELEKALPDIWNNYVQQVQSKTPAASPKSTVDFPSAESKVEVTDETPDPREAEPIAVVNRPEIPADAPRSQVQAPAQLTLGEVLGKIEVDNSEK